MSNPAINLPEWIMDTCRVTAELNQRQSMLARMDTSTNQMDRQMNTFKIQRVSTKSGRDAGEREICSGEIVDSCLIGHAEKQCAGFLIRTGNGNEECFIRIPVGAFTLAQLNAIAAAALDQSA